MPGDISIQAMLFALVANNKGTGKFHAPFNLIGWSGGIIPAGGEQSPAQGFGGQPQQEKVSITESFPWRKTDVRDH